MSKGPHVTDAQIEEILETMANEVIPLKEACKKHKLDYGNIWKRIMSSDTLKPLYARSRQDFARSKIEEMHEIAIQEPDVQRARLRTDLIKWEVSKVLPKEFGDKLEIDATLNADVKVTIGGDA